MKIIIHDMPSRLQTLALIAAQVATEAHPESNLIAIRHAKPPVEFSVLKRGNTLTVRENK